MSQAKRIIEEQEVKRQNKLDGYRKKLYMDNTYEMDCPYCYEALSTNDLKKEQCIHCGHDFLWKNNN